MYFDLGMDCVIDPGVGIFAWLPIPPSLADENVAWEDFFASEFLDSEPASCRVFGFLC
jgi:hypothetical protein